VAAVEYALVEHTGTTTYEPAFIMIINAQILLWRLKVKPMIGLGIEQAQVLFHGAVQLPAKNSCIFSQTS
jgi:hypothetical protein